MMVEPILKKVAKSRGVYEFKILMGEEDGTVNEADIDAGYCPGVVLFKPTRNAKYIPLSFRAYSYGVKINE